jgi:hypothetical protein
MPSWAQRSASQVPGEEAFDADDKIFAVGSDRLEKRLWAGFHVPVKQDLAGLVQDAKVHGASVQVDPTVKSVLLGVKAHEVSSSSSLVFPAPAYHVVCGGGGLNKYQPPAADAQYSGLLKVKFCAHR